MRISIYRNMKSPKPTGSVEVASLLEDIRGDETLAARTENARKILRTEGRDFYKWARENYPGVSWAGEFRYRNADGLLRPSGFVFVESDDLKERGTDAESEKARLSSNKHVAICYTSMSGDGVHALVWVSPRPQNAEEYRAAWDTAMREVGLQATGDKNVKDIARHAILASDPNLYANRQVSKMAWEMPPPPRKREPIATSDLDAEKWVDDALRAISPNIEYHGWINVGMALHAGEQAGEISNGLARWDSWSSGGDDYKPGEPAKTWGYFRRSGISLGTLWHLAQLSGWTPPVNSKLCRQCGKNFHDPKHEACKSCASGGQWKTCNACGERHRAALIGYHIESQCKERLTGEKLLAKMKSQVPETARDSRPPPIDESEPESEPERTPPPSDSAPEWGSVHTWAREWGISPTLAGNRLAGLVKEGKAERAMRGGFEEYRLHE